VDKSLKLRENYIQINTLLVERITSGMILILHPELLIWQIIVVLLTHKQQLKQLYCVSFFNRFSVQENSITTKINSKLESI
jgi:hypothetical protein